jgi:secondary thiamine-phosphate synthase enzyme
MQSFEIRTRQHSDFHEITSEVASCVSKSGVRAGAVMVYIPHTTAGITINENADPDVKHDMLASLEKMVPWNQDHFRHGEGNSAAHIKASMMGFSAHVPIRDGKLALGTWQGIYLCEFDGPRARKVFVTVFAEA